MKLSERVYKALYDRIVDGVVDEDIVDEVAALERRLAFLEEVLLDPEVFKLGEDARVNFTIDRPPGMLVGVKFKGEERDLLLEQASKEKVTVTKLVHALVCAYLRL